eukprot:gnl/MRDRNA2_/MRDRNA2_69097_c0_seq1.p1 gnl/MRDRNA2_/MRDRNA2_69097_c0~~gnl/MRDRNA2_/MRDRNA2_69097_c0_seq1.p1  ORF type:complete len:876 (+),score=186.44 gnl/MRDRNA2_/MRDRNA2_69097_c0_seq1:96-2630(+)
MKPVSYRRPKDLFPAAAAWIDDFSELSGVAGPSGRAKSSSVPSKASTYRRKPSEVSRKEPKTGSRISGSRKPSTHPAFGLESIKYLCDFVKRPRDTKRWQPGYQVTPKTAMTRSPRSVSPAFVQVSMPISDLRFRRIPNTTWDGLIRRSEKEDKEEGTTSQNPQSFESQHADLLSPRIPGAPEIPSDANVGLEHKEEEAEPEVKLTSDEEVARMSVFKQLQLDGEIHQDFLLEALAMLDFPRPDQSWVNEIVPTITTFTALNSTDFLNFVSLYNERQMQAFHEAFDRYDDDGSGEVDAIELAGVLKEFGVTPLPGILEENIAEVDVDNSGKLNVKEFITVLELQRSREGFSKSEVEEFQKAFRKFDRDSSGEVSGDELLGMLSWLGYPQRPQVVKSIVQRADTDGTGDLDWTEMLSCMRWIRETEVTRVHDLLQRYDADKSGQVDMEEVLPMLSELGYTANLESINDAVEDANLGLEDNAFDFNELWRLLHVFRRRCGFTRTEDEELIAAHQRYDKKKEGFINTLELGKALRLMGYSVDLSTQKKLLDLVDVDGSGKLDIAEFRTLMRMRREHELQDMKDVFNYYCDDKGKLSPANLQKALRRAGFTKNDPGASSSTVDMKAFSFKSMDFDGFWKTVSAKFKSSRERMSQNAGFTTPEVAGFRKMFMEFDHDGSGDIAGAELRKLMTTIFPDVNVSLADRKLMEEILNDVDQDGNGSIDFGDFLRLMRHYCDEHDRKQDESMVEGFTVEEVQQFKTIFESEDTRKTGALQTATILNMIQRICPLGAQARIELSKFVAEVQNGSPTIDINGFLQIMRHVIDVDLGGINEHARLIAASDDVISMEC